MALSVWKLGQGLKPPVDGIFYQVFGFWTFFRHHNFQHEIDAWESTVRCGFGCELHHAVFCLMMAYGTNRTLIYKTEGFGYSKDGFNGVFKQLSNNCNEWPEATHNFWPGKKGDQVLELRNFRDTRPRLVNTCKGMLNARANLRKLTQMSGFLPATVKSWFIVLTAIRTFMAESFTQVLRLNPPTC